MKTVFAISSLMLAQPIFGSLAKIDEMISEWRKNASSVQPNLQSRGAMLHSTSTLRALDNYGCFCYFDENHTKGSGNPKNDIDERCLALHQGYSCSKIDGDCDEPWNANYNVAVGFQELYSSTTPADIAVQQCNAGGNVGCMLRACIVEVNFAVAMFRDVTVFQGTYDQSLHHAQGFVTTTECPKKAPQSGSIACCGDFPTRAPYKETTDAGDRACCASTVYDSAMYCCTNDVIQIVGTCSSDPSP
jgi:hypothetical protein